MQTAMSFTAVEDRSVSAQLSGQLEVVFVVNMTCVNETCVPV